MGVLYTGLQLVAYWWNKIFNLNDALIEGEHNSEVAIAKIPAKTSQTRDMSENMKISSNILMKTTSQTRTPSILSLNCVDSESNLLVVDIFTKFLDVNKSTVLRNCLGLLHACDGYQACDLYSS
jgi:hypothetical protein